jgi:hypothetical protein
LAFLARLDVITTAPFAMHADTAAAFSSFLRIQTGPTFAVFTVDITQTLIKVLLDKQVGTVHESIIRPEMDDPKAVLGVVNPSLAEPV